MAAMQTAHGWHEGDGRACLLPSPGEPLHGADCPDYAHCENVGEKPPAGNSFISEFETGWFGVKLRAMRISVIVPAYNEEKLITASLQAIQTALTSFTQRGWTSEMIVCDNNSTDATAELARVAGAQVVFEPVNQIARARNTGAAAATGDWLMFVDADSRPTPELFAEVAQHIAGGRCLAGGCTVRLDERNLLADFTAGGWNLLSRIRKWVAGSFSFCERAAFDAVGGFSQELFASEEIDFSKKLNRLAAEQGRKVVILHRHPLATSARKIRLYSGAEKLGFLRKAIFNPKATVTSREACGLWYDGRR
jgi:glycosyltransferase involved in cell wall biosynthesis